MPSDNVQGAQANPSSITSSVGGESAHAKVFVGCALPEETNAGWTEIDPQEEGRLRRKLDFM
jgi:hypothetical protein